MKDTRTQFWHRSARHRLPASAWLPVALLSSTLLPHLAHATLGEPEASVQTDGLKFNGSIKSTERALYRVHEIQLPGTVLREFAALDGTVFAVVWSGPIAPNLRQTLGRYFDSYVAAANTAHADRHHLELRQGDLVIEASGHMRAFSGRAYLPQAVPAGVSLGELR